MHPKRHYWVPTAFFDVELDVPFVKVEGIAVAAAASRDCNSAADMLPSACFACFAAFSCSFFRRKAARSSSVGGLLRASFVDLACDH